MNEIHIVLQNIFSSAVKSVWAWVDIDLEGVDVYNTKQIKKKNAVSPFGEGKFSILRNESRSCVICFIE